MKTPMQELIQTLKEMQESLDPYGLHEAIEMAESMLEKEKETMCEFQDKAHFKDFWVKYEGSEDCFDKTFNTKQ
jgi:hypothetical protein